MLRKPRLHKRVTIKDVALKAGVSIGAVSRVLHGRASTIRVSEPTAEIIRQAALDLQYKPNRSSQSLRGGRTKAIGIAAPFEISFSSSPYYAALVDSIILHAGAKGFTVCLSISSMSVSPKFEDSKGKFDGLIWLGAPQNLPEEEQGRLLGTPQVGIRFNDSEVDDSIINVKADENQSIINYVGHLRVQDITKIGLFGKPGDSRGLLNEASLRDLSKRLAIEFHSYPSLESIADEIIASNVEAAIIWELSDLSSLNQVAKAVSKANPKVSVAAIVSDNAANGASSQHFTLPLDELCRSAVDILISKIENPQSTPASVALTIPHPN